MDINFNDLVSRQFLDPVPVTVPGVGVVRVRPVSAAQAVLIQQAMVGIAGEELEDYVSSKALEFVKGDEPTKEEVDAFRVNLAPVAISKIFQAGMDSDFSTLEDIEQTEKN